jgi:hypothetical protein
MEYCDILEGISNKSGLLIMDLLYCPRLTDKKVGLQYVEHDRRYEIADEFVRVLYK